MTAYTLIPGTIPFRAVEHLKTKPKGTKLTSAELGEALGHDATAISAGLTSPLKHGILSREKTPEGLNVWSLGDGTPEAMPDDYEADEPLRPAPSRLSKNAISSVFDLANRQISTAPAPAPAPVAQATSAIAVFGVFSDGRVVIEQGPHAITLNPDQAVALREMMKMLPKP